jgi:hypothetical protein
LLIHYCFDSKEKGFDSKEKGFDSKEKGFDSKEKGFAAKGQPCLCYTIMKKYKYKFSIIH